MRTLLQDLRYGLRVNQKSAMSAFAAVLTLALGIGASSAVLSVVNAILLKLLAYPNSGGIAMAVDPMGSPITARRQNTPGHGLTNG